MAGALDPADGPGRQRLAALLGSHCIGLPPLLCGHFRLHSACVRPWRLQGEAVWALREKSDSTGGSDARQAVCAGPSPRWARTIRVARRGDGGLQTAAGFDAIARPPFLLHQQRIAGRRVTW